MTTERHAGRGRDAVLEDAVVRHVAAAEQPAARTEMSRPSAALLDGGHLTYDTSRTDLDAVMVEVVVPRRVLPGARELGRGADDTAGADPHVVADRARAQEDRVRADHDTFAELDALRQDDAGMDRHGDTR